MTADLLPGFVTDSSARALSRTLEEPSWLAAQRGAAVARYAALPIESNVLFTGYVDLRAARFAEIEPYGAIGEAATVDTTVPDGASALIHVAEDAVVARGLTDEARAAGVVVDTFANVVRDRPELLREALETGPTLPDNDKVAALTAAMWSAGILIHVPRGVQLDGPVVVRWGVGTGGRGVLSRTVIDLAPGAAASVLEEQIASTATVAGGSGQSLWAGTTEVRLAEGASLQVASEGDFGADTIALVNRHATLERDASLQWALATVGGLLVKSRVDNVLIGRGASVRQVEIGFGAGRQLFDLTSYTRHVGRDTTGDLLSKGVFVDQARGYFKGMIQIQRTAVGTDSFLGEFAMLLAKKARSVAIPSLEIDQPDVRRASHASSVGPIDETQLFYLQSRGLPLDVARKFIVLGFLEPVVARIPLASAQDRLRTLLDRKWDGAHPGSARAA